MSGEEYDFTNILDKPIVIITFVFLVVVYMIYIYATNTSSSNSYDKDYYNVFEPDNNYNSFSDNDSISSGIFAKVIIMLFILVVVVKGYQILFNKTITASFYDFFTNYFIPISRGAYAGIFSGILLLYIVYN